MALVGRAFGSTALAIFLSLLCASAPRAGQDKPSGELQERCERKAAEAFQREFGTGVTTTNDAQSISEFSSHYNTKLEKCFVLRKTKTIPNQNSETGVATLVTLYSTDDNREYGRFAKTSKHDVPTDCRIGGKVCHSKQEWKMLIAPFMTE